MQEKERPRLGTGGDVVGVRAVAAAVLVAGVALAGCGGGSSSPAAPSANGEASKQPSQILADASAAAKAAASARVSGSVIRQGARTDLDLHYAGNDGATGTVSAQGVRFEVVRTGQDVYLRTDRAGYAKLAGAQAATLIGERWLKVGRTDRRFQSFQQLTTRNTVVDQVLSSDGAVTKGAATTVAGTPAIELQAGAGKRTLAVATTGQPYPLRLSPGSQSGSSGEIDFDEWNAPVTLATPSGNDVLDTSALR